MTGQRRRSKTAKLREEALLAAVLSQPTLTRAAVAAGVSERTVRRALKRPAFARRVATARRVAIEMAVTGLSSLSGEAYDAVKRALACGIPAVELKAGLAILLEQPVRGGGFLFELNDLQRLQEQLAELIERQREGKS
ncbi:MAG: hypothetical protein C0467_17600 [Planctomycetaceae bacterium]|nr:hypothetical protein [Planctomycetaceae bacterium]